jgi:hypothetical protein
MGLACGRDGAGSKENSLNSNAAREASPYGGAVQSNRFYRYKNDYSRR